jgi:hypothetical protein
MNRERLIKTETEYYDISERKKKVQKKKMKINL